MNARRYARDATLLVVLPLIRAWGQPGPFDAFVSMRLRPGPDERTRIETELRGAMRPAFAFGLGVTAAANAIGVSRLGANTGARYEARVGPSFRSRRADADLLVGGSRLTGERTTNAANFLGALVRLRLAGMNLTLTGEQTNYVAARLVTYDTAYVVAGFPFYSARSRVEPQRSAYSQVVADVSWTRGVLTSAATVGARASRTASAERWASARAAFRLGRGVSLVAEIGQIASVPEQRLRAARHATLAARFVPGSDPAAQPASSASSNAGQLSMIRDSSGVSGLRMTGLGAASVELMSDLTDWTPVTLRSLGRGAWSLALRVPPGVHRMVIRVDGGPWRPPAELPTTRSEFGETVGVLLVR